MRRPSRRTVIRALTILLLLGIVAPFVVQAVPQVVGADHSYVVLSGSMEPGIAPGDAVVVRDVSPSALHVGDIITFRRPGHDTPTTHRIVDVRQSGGQLEFRTKGDANDNADPGWTPASAVVGRVLFVLPYVGRVVLFANTKLGFAALVGLPFALLVVSELWSFAAGGTESSTTRAASDEADADPDASTPAAEDILSVADTEASVADTEAEMSHADATSDTDASEDAPATVSITHTDLRLTLPVLVAFAAYSVWIAYQHLDGVSVAVAAGTVSCTLFCFAAYYALRRGAADTSVDGDVAADGGVSDAE